jgi:hypothetical protein
MRTASSLVREDGRGRGGSTFPWKDYRSTGKTRHKAMTLGADEFMRRFLLHVLPSGFHRIRHYGLRANAGRRAQLAQARRLLRVVPATVDPPSTARRSPSWRLPSSARTAVPR